MNECSFSIPITAPFLDHASLDKYTRGKGDRRIGTTIRIGREPQLDAEGNVYHVFSFRSYHTLLALIYPDRVAFMRHNDTSPEASEWLFKIVRDNGISGPVVQGRTYIAHPPERERRKHIRGLCWCGQRHEGRVPRKLEDL
jgi:hypothetical protein